MSQLQAMRVFTRVVDLGSIHLATKQLGMSAAAVTRSVGMLEAHLNMRLRTLHPRIDFDVTTFDTHVEMVEGGYDVCFSDDRRLVSATLVSRRLTSIDEWSSRRPVVPDAARHAAPDFDSLLWAQQPVEKGPQLHRFHSEPISGTGQDNAVACGS